MRFFQSSLQMFWEADFESRQFHRSLRYLKLEFGVDQLKLRGQEPIPLLLPFQRQFQLRHSSERLGLFLRPRQVPGDACSSDRGEPGKYEFGKHPALGIGFVGLGL